MVFSIKAAGSRAPISFQVSCGRCVGCRAEYARQWAIRVVHESQMHESNCFVTLTYDDSHLPVNGSVDVRCFQLFAKRLRKRVGAFRYFACGEYGGLNFRPHYHACLFGVDWPDKVLLRSTGRGDRLYTSPLLASVWGQGLVSSGELSYESAAYVARYVMKKATGPLASKRYSRVDELGEVFQVKPEFCVMSRGGRGGKGGIGSSWFDKFRSDVYPHDEVVYRGRRFRPPRFYDKKLSDAELEVFKAKRRDAAVKYREDQTDARLRVREEVAIAAVNAAKREL